MYFSAILSAWLSQPTNNNGNDNDSNRTHNGYDTIHAHFITMFNDRNLHIKILTLSAAMNAMAMRGPTYNDEDHIYICSV